MNRDLEIAIDTPRSKETGILALSDVKMNQAKV
jgi:hypothetical protein